MKKFILKLEDEVIKEVIIDTDLVVDYIEPLDKILSSLFNIEDYTKKHTTFHKIGNECGTYIDNSDRSGGQEYYWSFDEIPLLTI